MARLRLSGLALLAAIAAGCSSGPAHPEGPTAECMVCVRNHDEQCRVVHIQDDTPHCEWDGRTWYFCSEECREAFLKQPETYAKRLAR